MRVAAWAYADDGPARFAPLESDRMSRGTRIRRELRERRVTVSAGELDRPSGQADSRSLEVEVVHEERRARKVGDDPGVPGRRGVGLVESEAEADVTAETSLVRRPRRQVSGADRRFCFVVDGSKPEHRVRDQDPFREPVRGAQLVVVSDGVMRVGEPSVLPLRARAHASQQCEALLDAPPFERVDRRLQVGLDQVERAFHLSELVGLKPIAVTSQGLAELAKRALHDP